MNDARHMDDKLTTCVVAKTSLTYNYTAGKHGKHTNGTFNLLKDPYIGN